MKNILKLTGLVLTIFLLVLVSSLSVEAVELNPDLKINVYCLHNQESYSSIRQTITLRGKTQRRAPTRGRGKASRQFRSQRRN